MKVHIQTEGNRQVYYFFCPGCKCSHKINDSWLFNGNPECPTFSPSVLCTWGDGVSKRCHSYVTLGRIEFLADSTHALAGKTVPLPDWLKISGGSTDPDSKATETTKEAKKKMTLEQIINDIAELKKISKEQGEKIATLENQLKPILPSAPEQPAPATT